MVRWSLLLLLFLPALLLAEPRQPWTTSAIQGSPKPPPPYRAVKLWEHLTFERAVDVAYLAEQNRMFVVERKGPIWMLPGDLSAAAPEPELFVDLSEHIPNLFSIYGMAFHPRFAENREVYIFYVDANQTEDGSHVARFRAYPDRLELDPHSREVLLSFGSGGHNGGHLQFGPDGMLYFLLGDLAPPTPPDPNNTGQDLSDLASSVLRIDVDKRDPGLPYAIPKDNPFRDLEGARPEIWAYGLRNPWKLCFHPETGDLWVGDVGWELWELLYKIERGGNYGWSITEGPQPIKPNQNFGPSLISPPVMAHPHTEAASITGGYVYQGERLPDLQGGYVYGDFVTGKMWALWHDGQNIQAHEEIADTRLQIVSFGQAAEGEVVFLNWDPPQHLYRLEPNEIAPDTPPFPFLLSETGLFQDTAQQAPAAGVYPFQIQAKLWQDGAESEYWVAVPDKGTIAAQYNPNREVPLLRFVKPEGTVLAKPLSLKGRRVETQILHFEGFWKGYTYRWNEDQTDAELVSAEGEDAIIDGTPWHFASRAECFRCHSGNFNRMLAFTPGQINHDGQLAYFRSLNLIDPRFVQAAQVERLTNPHDATQPIELRARSWLHANCSHCHRQSGGGSVAIHMNAQCPPHAMALLDETPLKGVFGLDDARLIAPGDPGNSVLYLRSATSGIGHMPLLGSRTVDAEGVKVLHDWIESLAPSDDSPAGPSVESSSAALRAYGQLNKGELTAAEQNALLEAAAQSKNPVVQGLFKPWLEDQ